MMIRQNLRQEPFSSQNNQSIASNKIANLPNPVEEYDFIDTESNDSDYDDTSSENENEQKFTANKPPIHI